MTTYWPFLHILDLPAMTLATTSPDGLPHAAPVYFANNAHLQFFFFSSPNSQHSQDLTINPQAAVAIYPLVEHYRDICGLQMRGNAQRLSPGAGLLSSLALLIKKFPYIDALQTEILKNALYQFTPQWIRWTNNQQGFGYKQEWQADQIAALLSK